MQQVKPYRTTQGALRALDNGGRFYNLFTSAGDDVVTGAELKRAARVVGSIQLAYLFFGMALAELDENERKAVESRLEPGLRRGLKGKGPAVLSPGDFQGSKAGRTYMVEGHLRRLADHEQSGFIYVPIQVGTITSMMLLPTSEVFESFEVTRENARGSVRAEKGCVVRIPKGRWKPVKNRRIRWGGLAQEMSLTQKKSASKRLYLAPSYYTVLN